MYDKQAGRCLILGGKHYVLYFQPIGRDIKKEEKAFKNICDMAKQHPESKLEEILKEIARREGRTVEINDGGYHKRFQGKHVSQYPIEEPDTSKFDLEKKVLKNKQTREPKDLRIKAQHIIIQIS